MEKIQESVEEQVGSLAEAFKGEFGEGMSKVCMAFSWMQMRWCLLSWRICVFVCCFGTCIF